MVWEIAFHIMPFSTLCWCFYGLAMTQNDNRVDIDLERKSLLSRKNCSLME